MTECDLCESGHEEVQMNLIQGRDGVTGAETLQFICNKCFADRFNKTLSAVTENVTNTPIIRKGSVKCCDTCNNTSETHEMSLLEMIDGDNVSWIWQCEECMKFVGALDSQ